MEVKIGKTGAIVSIVFLLGAVFWVFYFSYQLYLNYTLFPDLVVLIVLGIIAYILLKPSFLSYSILTFSKDHKLTIIRPFYKVKMFENAIQSFTLDLKQLEKVLVVIPERPSAPANYLFFMKEHTGKAMIILYFDEKEGKLVKPKLKKAKVLVSQKNIQDINYDSLLGVSTLN